MEAAPKKTANIFIVDVILYIFRFLGIEDRISFALSCEQFRQLCMEERVFRKMDLSKSISTTQREVMEKFFRDRQLTQHIRELNVSNLRVLNWWMDDHREEFIKSVCPHLEALHILDCGVNFQTLYCILQEAPNLTSLSWSIWDFTSADIAFLSKTMQSREGICLKKMKHLHLQILRSLSHFQIAKCLLLSYFRNLEELEIYIWWIPKGYFTGGGLSLPVDRMIPGFPQPSAENELQHLHSLMVVTVGAPLYANYSKTYSAEIYDFVVSVLSRKSSSTKWKKFWILPTIRISREQFSSLLQKVHTDDFQSVEAIGVDPGDSADTADELKTFFERSSDNNVKSLHLCLPKYSGSIVKFSNPISRVGGHSLKFLRLSVHYSDIIRAEQNVFIHSLFSNCPNITELDLQHYSFAKDVCEHLSELKHLTKVQLRECAISSKYENQVELSKANLLTFVENCKNITHLDVLGCLGHDRYFSCRLTDDDLLALALWRNLKSLTLRSISGIREWTFLKNISDHCRFLTTLRISATEHFNNSHIPILMESSRFLKHLVIHVNVPVLGSEVFWNLLSQAENLERLCVRTLYVEESLNVPVAMETLRSLPRLHVLHLHSHNIENADDFYNQIISMLEENESDCRFSFEVVTENRMNTWISQPTGHTLISNKLLPLNKAELCEKTPILDIPMV